MLRLGPHHQLRTQSLLTDHHLLIQVVGPANGELPAYSVQNDSAQALGLLHRSCQVPQGLFVVLDRTSLLQATPLLSEVANMGQR